MCDWVGERRSQTVCKGILVSRLDFPTREERSNAYSHQDREAHVHEDANTVSDHVTVRFDERPMQKCSNDTRETLSRKTKVDEVMAVRLGIASQFGAAACTPRVLNIFQSLLCRSVIMYKVDVG